MKAESWARLARAQKHYKSFGFKYKDVPWFIEPEISAITKPQWCKDYKLENLGKVLVGSAEQSFLSEYDELDDGLYYAITPCFRYELNPDELHKPYFMKLELFSKDVANLDFILESAKIFYTLEIGSLHNVERITLGVDDYDLNYKGIELGSYNIKQHGDWKWACGTGLAEPRFSAVLEK